MNIILSILILGAIILIHELGHFLMAKVCGIGVVEFSLLAYEAGKAGGSLPTVFNAANELAVSLFLEKKIPYLAITDLIQGAMENHKRKAAPNVDQILAAEQEAYDFIRETLRKERI